MPDSIFTLSAFKVRILPLASDGGYLVFHLDIGLSIGTNNTAVAWCCRSNSD